MGAVPLPKGKFGPRELVRWPVQTSRGLLYGFNEVNLENLLSSDEELLWWEEPRTGLTRHGNDWLVALMAVSLLLVPLILLDAASQTNDSIREGVGALSDTALFAIGAVGAVFVGSGIYLLAVHYWWDKRKRDDVAYAITTQRAFWARHHNSGLTVRSAPLWDIDSISMTRDADNRGTVRIRSGVIDWKVTSWKRGKYAWLSLIHI